MVMPPPRINKPLKPKQVETLSQWIAEEARERLLLEIPATLVMKERTKSSGSGRGSQSIPATKQI
jgi:hypothetical protein